LGSRPPRRSSAGEGLDDEHASAAAGAWVGERLCGRIGVNCLRGNGRGQVQGVARRRDGLGAIAAGEQAVGADAVEALGQDVDEETADELALSWLATGGEWAVQPHPHRKYHGQPTRFL
jgi:hypothetical protein